MSGELDERLRRAFAGIDTSAAFEMRVAARIAALAAAPRAADLARVERQRASAARRLAREAWMNTSTAIGCGAAAIAVVWRHGPAVARWTEDALAVASSPEVLLPAAMTVLAAGLWPVLRRLMPR
jgi:ferric-dicitrate binding protein FerR (iron transport regulator)